MLPKYVVHGLFSIKSDVFSFGIPVLEIVSGKAIKIVDFLGEINTSTFLDM